MQAKKQEGAGVTESTNLQVLELLKELEKSRLRERKQSRCCGAVRMALFYAREKQSYRYTVSWSPERGKYVATCEQWPDLVASADKEVSALLALKKEIFWYRQDSMRWSRAQREVVLRAQGESS